ncbi:MAG: 50S ribosomal protein L11 methyltransferase [Acidobacteria bacterium]|nr:50S ribosomal protein L11 methyltransferase [Acidobacteriota bacterium]
MISILLTIPRPQRDQVIAELWEAGTTGIDEEDDTRLRAYFEDTCDAPRIARAFAAYDPQVRVEEQRDWVAAARDMWQPVAVGERFYLVPAWRDDPARCGRVRLKINPGMACGTGSHPATQLCLMGLERTLEPRQTVLDVGTGSGILAHAAALLGAETVIACDIDHDAARIARENFASTLFAIGVFTGSLRSVRSEAVDLLLANISAPALAQLAPEMRRVLRGGGHMVLSGFGHRQTAGVLAALGNSAPATRLNREDWVCLIL